MFVLTLRVPLLLHMMGTTSAVSEYALSANKYILVHADERRFVIRSKKGCGKSYL